MTTTNQVGHVDEFGEADLRKLAAADGPCVSIYLPTHRAGAEVQQDPIRFRNLLQGAHETLVDQGHGAREVDGLLQPARELLDDDNFWQHQMDGLAVFAAPGIYQVFRVALPLEEEVSVASTFRVRPLLPLLTGNGRFLVLALSQNSVRLFEGSRSSISELTLGDIPANMAEALPYEDHEAELQVRSGGPSAPAGAEAHFHGHGDKDEVEKDMVLRFFQAVDRGLWARLDNHNRPLVLASVASHMPIYRSVSRHKNILEAGIEGSPNGLRLDEVHAAAWPIVEPYFTAMEQRTRERYAEIAGRGTTTSELAEAVRMAAEGRVDTLITAVGPPVWGLFDSETGTVEEHPEAHPGDSDLVDQAAVNTLLTGGTVVAVAPSEVPEGGPVAAMLRF